MSVFSLPENEPQRNGGYVGRGSISLRDELEARPNTPIVIVDDVQCVAAVRVILPD